MSTRTLCAFASLMVALFAAASRAHAQPTPLSANVSIWAESENQVLGRVSLFSPNFAGVQVNPNTTVLALPTNPAFAPPVTISMDVTTIGNQRTVSLRYESTSTVGIVTPAAAESLPALPPGGFYFLRFETLFSDNQWDGTPSTITISALDNGIPLTTPIIQQNSFGVSYLAVGPVNPINPALPGFHGNGVIDAYEFRSVYQIVPTPSVVSLPSTVLLLTMRRSRANSKRVRKWQ